MKAFSRGAQIPDRGHSAGGGPDRDSDSPQTLRSRDPESAVIRKTGYGRPICDPSDVTEPTMQKPPPPPPSTPSRPAAPEKTERGKRLASALRENLHRRKHQSRMRNGKEPR